MAEEVKIQKEYIKAWTDMMIDIWQEKIAKHDIIRTGALMYPFDFLLGVIIFPLEFFRMCPSVETLYKGYS